MQPIDLKEETEGSRERAGTRRRKERGEMNVSRADLAPSPIRQSSKSGQQPQLIWTAQLVLVLLVLLISSSNVGVSAQKSENNNDAPQIAANIDPEPVDGATDEEYSGQWEEAKARPMDHRKPPMEFIRKFSLEKQLMGTNMEQRKGKPASQTENEQYDEVLAARILAQEDVDRLSPAEGGDRIASNIGDQNDDYGNYVSTQKSIIKPASHLNNVYSSSSPSSISPFPSTTRSYTKIPSNLPSKLPNFPPGKISKQSEGTVALSELDLKSDGELAKIMQRTTLKTREYPIERTRPIITTTPFPLLATPVPPFPGFLFPHQPIHSAPQNVPQNPRQNRHHQRPEQFEKLGCEFDFMSQSCKDVFRIGWCQNCIDFGNNPFFHDCRCTAVTGLYVQTATFLGSSAASARANAALTAVASNQTSSSSHSYSNGGFGPFLAPLPLLPSLDQLAAPLVEITGPSSTSPPNFLAQTVTPGQVVQALADALRLPQTAMPLINPISSSNSAAQFQPQSPSNIPLAIPPLLVPYFRNISSTPFQGPPARAFGTSQFLPQNGAPIVPQFVSQGGNGKRK